MLNKSKKQVTLLDIPDEIMRYISKFLMIEDFLHLSMTCKILYHMLPRYAFEYKMIEGPDFEETPPKGLRDRFHSSFYFDTPPFTSHIFMVSISGNIWGDSSCDFEKGNINLQLIRPHHASGDSIAFEDRFNILSTRAVYKGWNPSPYPCRMEMSIEDPFINMIQPGDYFRFMKNVRRGGSPLIVKNFRVHTRGVRNKPTIIAQKRDSNALMQYSVTCSERLHTKKDCFANIVKKFKKKDEMEMKGYTLAYNPNMLSTGIVPDGPNAAPNTQSLPPLIPLSVWEYNNGAPPFNINDYT